MDIINVLINTTGLSESQIMYTFPYGSRVYGTHGYNSDYDYIVVYDGDAEYDGQQFDTKDGKFSFHTHSMTKWKEHIDNHKIFALECLFLGIQDCSNFKLDHSKLRSEISSKASNSWVKCKKKLTVEQNQYEIGIKSLFHSFRIPMFGKQIAINGRIIDYSEANDLWFNEFKPLLISKPAWSDLNEVYKNKHNQLMTEFRKHAGK